MGYERGRFADGVGEERSLSPSQDYSHPSLIVADNAAAGATFPKFGTNFLSSNLPITFCQAQPNFTCYHVIPHIFVAIAHLPVWEIKATGLRSSSFQSLVVESERLSFPTTGN